MTQLRLEVENGSSNRQLSRRSWVDVIGGRENTAKDLTGSGGRRGKSRGGGSGENLSDSSCLSFDEAMGRLL
jgi:hypothetical protein